jgi:dTDP-4-amino-4,6-dideoxygalactose transaminase
MAPILNWAREREILVLEDAAQAMGAEYPLPEERVPSMAGAMGDFGCLSFFPSKNLGGLGDGGMILTRDGERAARLFSLRVHGAEPGNRYHHPLLGGNFRLDALQAAVLRVKLNYLKKWLKARREKAAQYRDLFSRGGIAAEAWVTLPQEAYQASSLNFPHTYHQFVIRAPRRDSLREHLSRAGVETQVYYPLPLHLQAAVASMGYAPGDFPEAEKAARETLALPIYPELTGEEQAYVVNTIGAFYRKL